MEKKYAVIVFLLLAFIYGCDRNGTCALSVTTNEYVDVENVVDENCSHWWKFPIEMYVYDDPTPPECLCYGTNHPNARIDHRIAVPGQGIMPKKKYDLLQDALGAFISRGKKPHATIKEAVNRETARFWIKLMEEFKDSPSEGYGTYELHSEIRYRGFDYVSYSMSVQDGAPSSTQFRNFVWNWRTMRQLRIDEVIDMNKAEQLKQKIRKGAVKEVRDILEQPDYELPECAKDWPYDLSNFWIDEDGFVWRDEIGCCSGYTITRIEIRIKWADMRHLLRKDFMVPSFDL
jgi:hypothetical protein